MARLLEKTRYISLIGIISLLLASLAAFLWGAVKTVSTILAIGGSYGKDPYIAVLLIELVDSFLIATALFVFAVSMYEMFIEKIALPEWMLANNLPELKEKLGGVIILVMVVTFLEHLVEWKAPLDSLLFAIAVGVASAALIALGRFGGRE
ncbi:MAG: YqhA family protein [Anaerolineae bacterium]